jgi:hypothetical protein
MEEYLVRKINARLGHVVQVWSTCPGGTAPEFKSQHHKKDKKEMQ